MVKFIESTPTQVDIRYTPEAGDIASRLSPEDVEQVAEIFKTPLNGSYTWTYEEADKRIRKLYRLGKLRNWNA